MLRDWISIQIAYNYNWEIEACWRWNLLSRARLVSTVVKNLLKLKVKLKRTALNLSSDCVKNDMASVLISGPNCHLILLIEISNFLHLVTFWSDLITGSEILAASVAQFEMQDYARAYFNSNDCATIKLFSLFVCVNNLSHPGFIQQKEKGKIWIKASNTNLSLAGSSRSATTRAQCAWGLSYWAACIPVSNNGSKITNLIYLTGTW